jgi:hypothetical protein
MPRLPQWLKPTSLLTHGCTAEAVLHPNADAKKGTVSRLCLLICAENAGVSQVRVLLLGANLGPHHRYFTAAGSPTRLATLNVSLCSSLSASTTR